MSKKKSRSKASKKKRTIRSTGVPSGPVKSSAGDAAAIAAASMEAKNPPATTAKLSGQTAATVEVGERWDYVRRDVRHITMLAIACVGVELLLWWVLSFTSVGPQIYNLIQL